MHDYGDSELSNLVEIGITNSSTNPPWSPDIDHVSDKWKDAAEEQELRIGWKHILMGRISKLLIQKMDTHYSDAL